MKNWIPKFFVSLLLALSMDYSFAGDSSNKETIGKTDVDRQSKKSGHIWFSPAGQKTENSARSKPVDTMQQGQAGIIGDCGHEIQGRTQTQMQQKHMQPGIRGSDPCPDPEPVPTPGIKTPPKR